MSAAGGREEPCCEKLTKEYLGLAKASESVQREKPCLGFALLRQNFERPADQAGAWIFAYLPADPGPGSVVLPSSEDLLSLYLEHALRPHRLLECFSSRSQAMRNVLWRFRSLP